MNCFKLLVFFCFLTITAVFSQIEKNHQEDSLNTLLLRVKDDSVKMDLYNKLRKVTYYSNPINSEKYALKYLEYAQKTADSLNTAIANFFMGNANIVNGNAHLAINYYLRSAHYFEEVSYDPSRLSSVYNGIATAYENLYNDSLSLVYYQKSFDLSRRENDKKRMGIALVNMSNVMERKRDFSKVIDLLQKAEKLLSAEGSEIYLKAAYVNLISAYVQTDELIKAEKLIDVELQKVDLAKDVLIYSKIIENKGRLLVKKGNISDGLKFLNEAFDLYSKNGFQKEKINLYTELIEANYKQKNYKISSDLQFEFNLVKDSIFTFEKNKSLSEALQKYESEKKDKLLLENQLEIDRKNTQKNLIAFGLFVVLVFMIGGYIFFRKRLTYVRTIQKQQKDIQAQQIIELNQKNKLTALNSMIEGQENERLRIAKDLHDSLGGLLSNIKAHFTKINTNNQLNHLSEVVNNTNQLIDEACLEVRRISHNMMPHALSVSGLKGAIEDMASQLQSLNYNIELDLRFDETKLEQAKKNAAFRLIQEIISNINKHASANEIFIQLFDNDKRYHLIIEDNGTGFNYEEAIKKGGIGLKSINSRVEFLNGSILWDSALGKGTTININFPI